MNFALLLGVLAWLALAMTAHTLFQKRRPVEAVSVGLGAVFMCAAALTMTFAPIARNSVGDWPAWFWAVGALGPIGILMVSATFLRVSRSL
jgi:hypothetical protein